jgi:hypothetical protein
MGQAATCRHAPGKRGKRMGDHVLSDGWRAYQDRLSGRSEGVPPSRCRKQRRAEVRLHWRKRIYTHVLPAEVHTCEHRAAAELFSNTLNHCCFNSKSFVYNPLHQLSTSAAGPRWPDRQVHTLRIARLRFHALTDSTPAPPPPVTHSPGPSQTPARLCYLPSAGRLP